MNKRNNSFAPNIILIWIQTIQNLKCNQIRRRALAEEAEVADDRPEDHQNGERKKWFLFTTSKKTSITTTTISKMKSKSILRPIFPTNVLIIVSFIYLTNFRQQLIKWKTKWLELKSNNLWIVPTVDESVETELTPHSMSFVSPSSQKPLHKNEPLNWKYKVNLIGEKVVNPRIHCCDKCMGPILVYGRMVCTTKTLNFIYY